MAVAEALPPTSDPNWATVVSSSNYQNAIRIPEVMEFQTTLTAGTEGNAFPVQPVLQFRESNVSTCVLYTLWLTCIIRNRIMQISIDVLIRLICVLIRLIEEICYWFGKEILIKYFLFFYRELRLITTE